jgi:hypothetical protein
MTLKLPKVEMFEGASQKAWKEPPRFVKEEGEDYAP